MNIPHIHIVSAHTYAVEDIQVRLTLYTVIALAPNTPATAEATAITTFRIISHTDFFIAIIPHTSFPFPILQLNIFFGNRLRALHFPGFHRVLREETCHLEARARFDPFLRFNFPVSIAVGT